MTFTISAHVTVDLSKLGGNKASVPGKLTNDEVGVPTEVEFEFPGASSEVICKLLAGEIGGEIIGQQLIITTHLGMQVIATLEAISHIEFQNGKNVSIRGSIGNSQIIDPAKSAATAYAWQFSLANLKLRHGDEWVEYPPPPKQENVVHGPQSLSRIRFSVAGREWVLTDEMYRFWKNCPDPSTPVESGTLTTPYSPCDTSTAVALLAEDIEMILTLALGRGIRFASISKIDAGGGLIAASSRRVHIDPFNVGGSPPIDNWNGGVLRSLIESAQPVIAANRIWWTATLGLYWQAHSNKFLEIKTAILNILVDRISTELTKGQRESEIDEQLPKRADEKGFKAKLHELLTSLSPHWTEQRTEDIVRTIKDYNARPSFPKKVAKACETQQLPLIAGKLLGTRHLLLHVGKLEPPDGDVMGYWTELDALVLMLILRMLRYEGPFYHTKFGPNEVHLKDRLVAPVGPQPR